MAKRKRPTWPPPAGSSFRRGGPYRGSSDGFRLVGPELSRELPGARQGEPIDVRDYDTARADRLNDRVAARGWDLLDHITGLGPLDRAGEPAGLPSGRQVWVTHSIVNRARRTLIGPVTIEDCEAYMDRVEAE
jgi:hypothetical protein